MANSVQLLQHVDLLHADGGLGFQKEFDYIQAATVEKKGSYVDGGDCGDGDGDSDGDLTRSRLLWKGTTAAGWRRRCSEKLTLGRKSQLFFISSF